jgi:hypothetical protein
MAQRRLTGTTSRPVLRCCDGAPLPRAAVARHQPGVAETLRKDGDPHRQARNRHTRRSTSASTGRCSVSTKRDSARALSMGSRARQLIPDMCWAGPMSAKASSAAATPAALGPRSAGVLRPT